MTQIIEGLGLIEKEEYLTCGLNCFWGRDYLDLDGEIETECMCKVVDISEAMRALDWDEVEKCSFFDRLEKEREVVYRKRQGGRRYDDFAWEKQALEYNKKEGRNK